MRWTHMVKYLEESVKACWVYSVESVSKILDFSVTFPFFFFCNMWGYLCSTDQIEFQWSRGYTCNSSYCYNQIGSINLSHCYHILPWFCVWRGCTFKLSPSFTNSWIHWGMKIIFFCLHISLAYYHPYADISESIEQMKWLLGTFCRA